MDNLISKGLGAHSNFKQQINKNTSSIQNLFFSSIDVLEHHHDLETT